MALQVFKGLNIAISNGLVEGLRVVQFWFEITFAISNHTLTACLFDFEITHMVSGQIALNSVY